MMRIVKLMLVVLVIALQPPSAEASWNDFTHWWAVTFPGYFVTGWTVTRDGLVTGWNKTADFFTRNDAARARRQKLLDFKDKCVKIDANYSEDIPLLVPDSEIANYTVVPKGTVEDDNFQCDSDCGKQCFIVKDTNGDEVDEKTEPEEQDLGKFNIYKACDIFVDFDDRLETNLNMTRAQRKDKFDKVQGDASKISMQGCQQNQYAAQAATLFLQCDELLKDHKEANPKFLLVVDYDGGQIDTGEFCQRYNAAADKVYNFKQQGIDNSKAIPKTRVGGYDDSYESDDHDTDSADN